MRSLTVRTLLSLALCALLLPACSSTGSGSKTGEGEGLSEADLAAQREGRFGAGGIPTAEGEGFFRDVNFDYDSSAISDTARQAIEYNFEVMKANPDVKVVLEGHCDERGTAEYNLALGAKRARGVKDVLISLGASPSKVDTISYGEEVPLDPSHSESAWVKNRRVHFSPTRGDSHR